MTVSNYLLMLALRTILVRDGIKHSFGGLFVTIIYGDAVGVF